MPQQVRRGCGRFEHGARRREVAAEHGNATVRDNRPVERPDDFRIERRRVAAVVPDSQPIDRHRVLVQKAMLRERAHDGEQPARVIEVLHHEAAGRHHVGQRRHGAPERVPIVERQRHARASCHRQQMNDRVRGPAYRAVHADGVLKCLPRQNLRDADIVVREIDDAAARFMRERVPP